MTTQRVIEFALEAVATALGIVVVIYVALVIAAAGVWLLIVPLFA